MKHDLTHISHIPHFYIIRSVEAKLLRDYIDKKEGPFLDLGCGDGGLCETLALDDVYGMDINDLAVKVAEQRGCYKKVLPGIASDMPFPGEFFGTVFSNCAIEHMDELDKVLREINRVLKAGGVFIFTVPTRGLIDKIGSDNILKKTGLNNEDIIQRYNDLHNHVNLFNLPEWNMKIEEAGFQILNSAYYLPGFIGRFVARMDVLHTIKSANSKALLSKLERKYSSPSWWTHRLYLKHYMSNPHTRRRGTHLLIKAKK